MPSLKLEFEMIQPIKYILHRIEHSSIGQTKTERTSDLERQGNQFF